MNPFVTHKDECSLGNEYRLNPLHMNFQSHKLNSSASKLNIGIKLFPGNICFELYQISNKHAPTRSLQFIFTEFRMSKGNGKQVRAVCWTGIIYMLIDWKICRLTSKYQKSSVIFHVLMLYGISLYANANFVWVCGANQRCFPIQASTVHATFMMLFHIIYHCCLCSTCLYLKNRMFGISMGESHGWIKSESCFINYFPFFYTSVIHQTFTGKVRLVALFLRFDSSLFFAAI